MHIKKIRVTNYRSCLNTEFTPDEHLSALIGPNATGKTNVLAAIRLLRALLSTRHRYYRGDERPATSASEIKTWFDVDGKTVIHTAKLDIHTDEHNRDEILSSHERWYMRDVTGKSTQLKLPIAIVAELFSSKRHGSARIRGHERLQYMFFDRVRRRAVEVEVSSKARQVLEQIAEFILQIKYYSASQFTDPSNCPISFEVERDGQRRHGISISGHKRLLFNMYQQRRAGTPGYKEYISLVNQEGIRLVDDITFEEVPVSSSEYRVLTGGRVRKKERTKILVVPQFVIGNSKLSPSQLSEGTFKTLALLFYLVTETSSLLMIEEPEVCVHHGLLSSIVELIKIYSREKQIIISTHSDAVLDDLDVANVFRVTKSKGSGTAVAGIARTLGQRELRALREYLRADGTLGEYWRHGDLEDG